jgi:hypothetical protein
MIASAAAKRRIQCRAPVGRRRGEGVLESFVMGMRGCGTRVTDVMFKSIFSFPVDFHSRDDLNSRENFCCRHRHLRVKVLP